MRKPATLQIPDRIAHYTLTEVLGHGGMGVVSKARDERTGQYVALKVLHTPQVGLFSLLREINAIKNLQHPGVVTLLDSGVENNHIWYAMEYLEAIPLRNYLPKNRMSRSNNNTMLMSHNAPQIDTISQHSTHQLGAFSDQKTQALPQGAEENQPLGRYHQKAFDRDIADFLLPKVKFGEQNIELLGFAAQIAKALAYIHAKGLVHCDLKPENVLISQAGRAILIDFGIVIKQGNKTASEELSESGLVIGTALYMAPERIRRTTIDPRADLYALGCIMYQMLVGFAPVFHEETNNLIGNKYLIRSKRPSLYIDDLPPELDELVVSLLEDDPKKRPGYAQSVLHVLEKLGIQEAKTHKFQPKHSGYLYKVPPLGRESVIQEIQESISRSILTQGSALLITGESGIGKTSLASTILQYVRQKNFFCLSGRALPLQQNENPSEGLGLTLFADIFRYVVDKYLLKPQKNWYDHFSENTRSLLPFFPFLNRLSGIKDHPLILGLSTDEAHQRLLDEVISTIEKTVGKSPLVLIFDDIQWADPLSLACLHLILNRVARKNWFIILLGRSDLPIQQKLLQREDVEQIQLKTLEKVHHKQFIQEMMGGARFPSELLTYIQNQTNGNPLYMRLCIQSAIDEGYLYLSPKGRWHFDLNIDDLLLASSPKSLVDILQLPLQHLTEAETQLCNTLAVFGQATKISHLGTVLQCQVEDIADSVKNLVRRSILVEPIEADDMYLDFLHWGVADLLTAAMDTQRLKNTHLTIAQLLEASLTEPDKARLARHYDKAALPLRARKLYVEAAEQAINDYAIERASVFFERALALYENTPEINPIRMRHATVVLVRRGFIDKAKKLLLQVIIETAEYDMHLMASAQHELANVLRHAKEYAQAEELLEKSAHFFQEHGNHQGIADCWMLRGILQLEQCNYAAGIQTLQELQGFALEMDMPEIYSTAGRNIIFTCLDTGKYQEALDQARNLLKRARADKNIGEEINLINFISLNYMYQGEMERSLLSSQEALTKAQKYRLKKTEMTILGNMGLIHMQLENYAKSIELSEEVSFLAGDLGFLKTYLVSQVNILLCQIELAQFSKAGNLIKVLEPQQDNLGHYLYGYLMFATARLDRYLNDPQKALPSITKGLEIFKNHQIRQPYAVLLCEYGHVQLALGHPTEEIQNTLMEASSLMAELQVAEDSELGVALRRLQKAQQARLNGVPLVMGSHKDDLPEKVLLANLHS